MFVITFGKLLWDTFLTWILNYHVYLFIFSLSLLISIPILKIKKNNILHKTVLVTVTFMFIFISFFWKQMSLAFILSFKSMLYFLEILIYFMVGVLICFYKSDERQKVFKIFPQKSKYAKYTSLKDPYLVWAQPKPLETLIMLDVDDSLNFYTKTTTGANFLHFSLPSASHYFFYLYLRINSGRVYTPLDLSYVGDLRASCLVSSCYFSSFFLVTHTVHTTLDSISTIYSSFNWVEREVLEFFDVYINGLKDSRRLLTDYTVLDIDNQSYKTTSYDGLTQNLYFN